MARRLEALAQMADERSALRRRGAADPVDAASLVIVGAGAGAGTERADHAGGDSRVADLVDQDEGAELAIVGIGQRRDGAVEVEPAVGNVVEPERGGGGAGERVDVDLLVDRGDRGRQHLGADLHQIGAARGKAILGHPHQRGVEPGGERNGLGGEHVAARNVELVGERERDRLAGGGGGQVAVEADDAGDGRRQAGARDGQAVAGADAAAGDLAGIATEGGVGAVDPLDRHSRGGVGLSRGGDGDGLEMLDQRRP